MQKPTILRFISILYRYNQILIGKRLEPYGVGPGQYAFILPICRQPGISQDGLSDCLVIDKGTTAKAVKALEQRGYVVRKTDLADKRAYMLYATEKGERLRDTLEQILHSWQDILWQGFDEKEKEMAYEFVVRMATNAKNHMRRECGRRKENDCPQEGSCPVSG